MADGMDTERLRSLVNSAAGAIAGGCTHDTLGETCTGLGLLDPPRHAEPDSGEELSKRKRVDWSLARLADEDVPAVARRMLDGWLPAPLNAAARNAIQDILWTAEGALEIPKRTRRDIARALDLDDVTARDKQFMALLDRLWVLGGDDLFAFAFRPNLSSLRGQVEQHVLHNPGDWSAEYLFDQLGAIDAAGDARFTRFLEGLASADVVPDVDAQQRVVDAVNPHLRAAGAELRESGEDGGYPVFTITSTRAARGQPKNLIFASPTKPDIRITDAINNDIEILSDPDDVLVYDRPTREGVLWRDLQTWWKETRCLPSEEEAKSTLYDRLLASMPENLRLRGPGERSAGCGVDAATARGGAAQARPVMAKTRARTAWAIPKIPYTQCQVSALLSSSVASPAALNQLAAGHPLQLGQGLGDGGLAQVEALRGTGHGALLGDGHEAGQVPQRYLHALSLGRLYHNFRFWHPPSLEGGGFQRLALGGE
jgi:hypothetical protein